jgi:hypothetical protein
MCCWNTIVKLPKNHSIIHCCDTVKYIIVGRNPKKFYGNIWYFFIMWEYLCNTANIAAALWFILEEVFQMSFDLDYNSSLNH